MRHSRWRKRLRDWKKALRDCYCVCGTAAGGNGFALVEAKGFYKYEMAGHLPMSGHFFLPLTA